MVESLEEKRITIPVVDDTDIVLAVVGKILKIANCNVLQADSGFAALELAASYRGKIDLLLTEVQMPGMFCPALGQALKKSRPGIQVILMSTFTGGDLLAGYGWPFIEKPFAPPKLLELIDVVLHGGHGKEMRAKSADAG